MNCNPFVRFRKAEQNLNCCYNFFLPNDLKHIGFHFSYIHEAVIITAILCGCAQGGGLILEVCFVISLGANFETR